MKLFPGLNLRFVSPALCFSHPCRLAWRRFFLQTAAIVALVVPVFLDSITAPRLRAQASAGQSPTVPQWQNDAGGKMAFDVASVKQNLANQSASPAHANMELDPTERYTPAGGLFSV